MLFFPTVDEDFQYFRSQGYSGSLNDMHYKAMGDLGYTGSLSDRIHAFLTFKYGSFYEAMRDLRNGTSIFSLLSAYAVNSFDPSLVFDFEQNYYRTGGTDTTLNPAVTHSRAGQATMTDGYGAEEVTNGDFTGTGNVTNWTLEGTATNNNGVNKFDVTAGASTNVVASQTIALTIGKAYQLSFERLAGTVNCSVSASGAGLPTSYSDVIGVETRTFIATASSASLLINSGAGSTTVILDNVSVKEAPAIKWAPHNLMPYSEDFSNSSWYKTSCVVTANVVVAPDGSTTADEIIPDTTAISVRKAALTSSLVHTASVWVKDAGRGACFVSMGSNTKGYLINVDLTDGSYISGRSYGGGVLRGYSITSGGNGWYRVSVSASNSTAAGHVGLVIGSGDGVSSASGVYVWGGHVYRSDLGGMVNNPAQPTGLETYVPTASSAVYLPRVGHHIYNGNAWVNEGVLHESEARTNLLTYSNQANQLLYHSSGVTTGVDTTEVTSPAGSGTAIKLNKTSSGFGFARVSYSSVTNAQTLSSFVKKGTARYIGLRQLAGTATHTTFDLENNTWVQTAGSTSRGYEDYGNGWLRLFVVSDDSNSKTFASLCITNASGVENSSETGTVYVYGLQREAGVTPSSYIPTSGSTVTRAAETLTVPAANMPWPTPVETTGTELVTNGDFATDSDWTKGTGVTISGGYANASSATLLLTQTLALNSGSVYKVSFDYTMSSGVSLRIEGAGILATTPTLSTSGVATLYITANSTTFKIAASGATFTGTIDNVSIKEINPLSVSIQMDGRMTYADTDLGNLFKIYHWYSDSSNNIYTRLDGVDSRTGQIDFYQEAGNVVDKVESSTTLYSPGINVPFNISSRHGSTFLNGAVDGTALTANTTPTALPDLSSSDLDLGYDFMGTIGKFRVWSDDLTDTGIATATAPSTEPSLQLTFDGSSTSSFTVLDWSE